MDHFVAVPVFVPLDSGLRVIAVGSNLHGGSGAMLVVCADPFDELLLRPVSPQFQPIFFDCMHTEFRLFSRLNALGPNVSRKSVAEQPEVIRLVLLDGHIDSFGAVPVFVQHDFIRTGVQVGRHRSRCARTGLRHPGFAGEFEHHIRQCHIAFVADVSDQHEGVSSKMRAVL